MVAHSFWCPTCIEFGIGSVDNLVTNCAAIKGSRALLVSGKRFALATGLIDRIEAQLEQVGIRSEAFPHVEPEPKSNIVDSASDAIRRANCNLVVAVGGGSAIDVAKLAALLAANGGRCVDYEAGRPIKEPTMPVIAIPTSAGSGSEVTPYSVIKNETTKRKFTITHPSLYPRFAVVDPSLTVSLPRRITLASGLDAWAHALEGRLSRKTNPLINPWAEYAIHLVYNNLATVLHEPTNLDARANMSQAALIGGLVISHVRTGMIHTISVALSAHVALPHGLLNAIITPFVLEFNSEAYGGRLKSVAQWLGAAKEVTNKQAVSIIGGWLRSLGVPASLASYNLDPAIVPSLVSRVNQDVGLRSVNARPFSDRSLVNILERIAGS